MILLIDNYDSFVYTLARYVGLLGLERHVVRNDDLTLDEIDMLSPRAIILSPGPGEPKNAGIMPACIQQFGHKIPILGICLGHQAISEAYGGITIRATPPMHGKTSPITHNGHAVFRDVPTQFMATRYHSLVASIPSNNNELEVIARTDDDIIMGIAHKTHPVIGLQFHPESCLTEHGLTMLANFFDTHGIETDRDHNVLLDQRHNPA